MFLCEVNNQHISIKEKKLARKWIRILKVKKNNLLWCKWFIAHGNVSFHKCSMNEKIVYTKLLHLLRFHPWFHIFLPYINDLPDHWAKCPNIELFLVRIFLHSRNNSVFGHAVDVIGNIIIYAYDNNIYSKCNQVSHLRIKWRLIFALVIRCSRLQLWVGYLHLHSFNGYFWWMFFNSVKEKTRLRRKINRLLSKGMFFI